MRTRPRRDNFLVILSLTLLPALLGGCVVVKPWEREVLSLRPMDPASEQAEDKFRQHWQESREGARGGFAAAGGGCGCN